ncbi:alpha-L-fucosidase [Microbacterium hydrocarbonoxydans]|uniref:alpha-L-fucosidase n=1 Tax=Microbacterium hydrocarbonoxydans TaxID=273678 RepID=UPI00203F8D15|nr:alpha-L-fucosidase [Microbacterium hydrocarbonoxydans]MCM3778243.1 alpha-L-fucosidase [Microbacterium hydrocarbonoxydans]
MTHDDSVTDHFPRSAWFRHDRFGLFIHFGAFSASGRDAWYQSEARLTPDEYQTFVDGFRPDLYDAEEWADHAVDAGVRYAVLTTRHHEGFALWDTAVSDFGVMHHGVDRDLVREFLDAFRSRGIKVGLYYSLIDWHHPDYIAYRDWTHPRRDDEAMRGYPHEWSAYVDMMHAQVRELCSGYGPLDLFWFDMTYPGDERYHGRRPEDWRAEELIGIVRSLQPGIVVNNRLETSGAGFGSLVSAEPTPWSGDFVSPEMIIPADGIRDARGRAVPWEACITHNNHWGYYPLDVDFKTPTQLVRKLVECVSKGGNLLVNVGPTGRGEWPRRSIEDLAAVGSWLERNGRSIHGAGPAGLPKPEWGYYTRRGDVIYAHVLEPPLGPLPLPGLAPDEIVSLRWLHDGSVVQLAHTWVVHAYPGGAFAAFGPDDSFTYPVPDPIDSVLEIRVRSISEEPPSRRDESE